MIRKNTPLALAFALLLAASTSLPGQERRPSGDSAPPQGANRSALVTPDGERYDTPDEAMRGGGSVGARSVVPVPNDGGGYHPHPTSWPYPLIPEIWTTSSSFPIGASMDVYFRVSDDAFVYIFNTDSRGRTTQIFPNWFDRNNFVRARRVYRTPDDRSYNLEITGPAGIETLTILAVAERYPEIVVYEQFSQSVPFPTNIPTPLDMIRRFRDGVGNKHDRGGDGGSGRPGARAVVPVPNQPPQPGPSYGYGVASLSFRTYDRYDNRPPFPLPPIPLPPIPRPPVRDNGWLKVTTAPSNARVYLDGNYQGRTPLTVDAAAGTYELLVQKSGFRTEVRHVRVRSNDRQSISLRMLPLAPGTFRFEFDRDDHEFRFGFDRRGGDDDDHRGRGRDDDDDDRGRNRGRGGDDN